MSSNLKITYYIAIIMSEDNQKKQDSSEENVQKNQGPKEEKSLEEKLKESDDKLLRSLAEIENQRRRF